MVARLKWLEDFAKTCPLVSFGSYGGGPEDLDDSGPKKVGVVAAQQSSQFEYVEGDLAPYRPLDAGRLKLTGLGDGILQSTFMMSFGFRLLSQQF